MNIDLQKIACFGVAGNFTGHLEQAGEDKDFKNVVTNFQNEPKAVFPTYIPCLINSNCESKLFLDFENFIPEYLKVFPFDEQKILFPFGEEKIQIEPECAIIFELKWDFDNKKVVSLNPVLFGASNDCSIRKEGAKKISIKKNWGKSSKGLSSNLIKVDFFEKGSVFDNYRIASFLIRENEIFEYGEDSLIINYNYFYKKLIDWLIEKLNNQKDFGPAENINFYLCKAGFPNQIMVSVGATRYTEFGKTNFLQNGDFSVVILYTQNKYSKQDILKIVKEKDFCNKNFNDISVLCQKVIV